MYHEPVTFTSSARRRRIKGAYQCTAAAGGKCQLGQSGTDLGIQISDCESSLEKCSGSSRRRVFNAPAITSQDGKVNVRLWLNLTMSAVNGIDHKTGQWIDFAHACGWKKQWSLVIGKNGTTSLFESEHGSPSCPSNFEPTQEEEAVADKEALTGEEGEEEEVKEEEVFEEGAEEEAEEEEEVKEPVELFV